MRSLEERRCRRADKVHELHARLAHIFGDVAVQCWEWALVPALQQSRWDVDRAVDRLKVPPPRLDLWSVRPPSVDQSSRPLAQWKITPFVRLEADSGKATLFPEREVEPGLLVRMTM